MFPQGKLTEGLHSLLQPLGGLFSSAPVSRTRPGEPLIFTRATQIGRIDSIFPHLAGNTRISGQNIGGGAGLSEADALIPALAEGLERYSASVFREQQLRWATGEELAEEALDLDSVPRCSARELTHPKCPIIAPDKTRRIRWVRGISVFDGRIVYVPAVMVYSTLGFADPAERFWLPISTGCAAHTSYGQAALNAICEVIERDAISVTWLQMLPLPRLILDCTPAPLNKYWTRYLDASKDLSYQFFDATSDLGVPTVYGLQVAQNDKRVATLVSCATGMNLAEAVAKAFQDLAVLRQAFRREMATPDSWDDFTDLLHGATYMARAESAIAFRFLTETTSEKRLSDSDYNVNPPTALHDVVDTLRRKRLNTYLVDISTDEALRSGMRVVRAIIPGLQPLSLRYRAQFLAHSRLYSAPIAMGYRAHAEERLNRYPQPFA